MKGNPTWGHVLREDPVLSVLREEIASLLIFIKNKVEMICQFALDYGYQYWLTHPGHLLPGGSPYYYPDRAGQSKAKQGKARQGKSQIVEISTVVLCFLNSGGLG